MKFILTAGWEDGIADLTQCLIKELSAGKKVVWLLSGGSNIPVSVEVMGKISAEQSKNLTITLADERYAQQSDHPDSNWTKLLAAGFDGKQATLRQILVPGSNFEQTVNRYEKLVKECLSGSDIVFAQLGIGDDGHVAGILPDSPASTDLNNLVNGYQSQPFLRLTLTFKALKQVDVAYAFAFGSNKHDALATLQDQKLPLDKQPAQILKQIPKSFLYSDQVGEQT